MTLVEKNDQYLLTGKGRQLMDDFCAMVRCDNVWPFAEMVVPQFRMSMAEKSVLSHSPCFFEAYRASSGNPQGNCLQHVLSNVVDRLPARNDLHLLTTEQDMMRSRLKNQARALMTGGHTQDELCVEDEEELDALLGKFDSEFIPTSSVLLSS